MFRSHGTRIVIGFVFVCTVAIETCAVDEPYVFRDVAKSSGLMPVMNQAMGHGAAWGDVDGDGWPDLYIGTFHYKDTHPNRLFMNRRGKFSLAKQKPVELSTRSTGVLFVDLDNDGDLDLYVSSMPAADGGRLAKRLGYPLRGCSLFRNDGKGKLTDVSNGNVACPESFGGRSVTATDIDGDGLLDLLVGEDPLPGYNGSQTKSSRLFKNLGNLKFEDVSQECGLPKDVAGLGVAAGDLNLDGAPDLFIASTLGNHLLLNDGTGKFSQVESHQSVFEWKTAKGDDMVCGVAIGDVNHDGLPDIILGQHYSSPWVKPVANRLYLNRGMRKGVPKFEDVTEAAGLTPLPLKGPHVEIQDFDNDGKFDIYTSIVKFKDGNPYPVIFRNLGNRQDGIPRFSNQALGVNDFPTDEDRAVKRSGKFFEKMIKDRKIVYTAPGPTCDFDRDGKLDMVLPSWWTELPTMLLKNETKSGNWLQVKVASGGPINSMGIGCRVELFESGRIGDANALLASREIATGFGYASSHEATAHFGLGSRESCDVVVTLPFGKEKWQRADVKVNQRIVITKNLSASE